MTVNVLQCSFTGGEVAEDVAARVDLEKYQESLLRAKNVFIRPYGGVYKRPGTAFVKAFPPGTGAVRLHRFSAGGGKNFLLVFTQGLIEVYLDDVLAAALDSPFGDADLPRLDFAQSANTLFIASGRLSVKQLFYDGAGGFSLSDFPVAVPPFDEARTDIALTVSAAVGTFNITASAALFDAGWMGDFLKVYQAAPAKTVDVGTTSDVLCGAGWSFVTRGNWTGTITIERRDTEEGQAAGAWYKFKEYKSVYSTDQAKNGGMNYTDSGAATNEPFFLRLKTSADFALTSDGTAGTLTSNSYVAQGVAKITAVNSATQAQGKAVRPLGQAGAAKSFARGLWNFGNGYPKNVCFFQDRLCFGGSDRRPNGLWMSRTSDYTNFDVTEAAGKLTDDSAINTNIVAREFVDIKALVNVSDLLIFTSGDIWLVSGASVAKPSELNIRAQSGFGASDIPPLVVGPRVIYAQAGNTKIRDAGYTFESDGYSTDELTVFIPHLAGEFLPIVDLQQTREPEQKVFALRGDGALLCLTYLREQKVFAWSTIETQGKFMAIGSVRSERRDVLYAAVERDAPGGGKALYLERFTAPAAGGNLADYCLVDCAQFVEGEGVSTVAGLGRFAGQKVQVIGDSHLFDEAGYLVADDGALALPYACDRLAVGLPYELEIALPDLHASLPNTGSSMGHRRVVDKALLRLESSFGGVVFTDAGVSGRDIFTLRDVGRNVLWPDLKAELFTGVMPVTLSQDTNYHGRVVIRQGAALPFKLSAVGREVKFT
ncbi:MAG: hypothetical protein LBO03_09245 [Acidaminococcales bacterium]|nr:hypothetical protein [Acidaminococcales bacterium]